MKNISSFIFIILLNFLICRGQELNKTLNEECTVRDGAPGICLNYKDCPLAKINLINKGIKYTICSYKKNRPIICCSKINETTTTTSTTTTTISPEIEKLAVNQRKCIQYSKYVNQTLYVQNLAYGTTLITREKESCYKSVSELISGGKEAIPKEFPHMAVLAIEDDSEIRWICGGTLISEKFVMTAGHCIVAGLNLVRLGDLNLNKTTDDAQPENYRIEKVILHPEYNRSIAETFRYNDIALIKLNSTVKFNPYIRPACLTNIPEIPSKFIATGWGRTGYFGSNSNILLKVQLELFTFGECDKIFVNQSGLTFGIKETQICAGSRSSSGDTCGGDSGGPLQISHSNHYCMYSVIGITSVGFACGTKNVPAIYTNVYPYIKWIEDVVWKT